MVWAGHYGEHHGAVDEHDVAGQIAVAKRPQYVRRLREPGNASRDDPVRADVRRVRLQIRQRIGAVLEDEVTDECATVRGDDRAGRMMLARACAERRRLRGRALEAWGKG